MILPRLLLHFARHGDDAAFYRMQADDAIGWLERSGVRVGPGVRALDLGCGHGVFGAALRERGCGVLFADEQNALLPELAGAPFQAINLDRDSPGCLGRHDLVVCSNVLEHLSRPHAFLESAADLVAPGGVLYLSWTNWLSPWGGHEFSPLHYFGPRVGVRLHDALGRRKRFHTPGVNLFPTHIGRVLRWIRDDGTLRVDRRACRYYPEFSLVLRLPVVREFLAWNCALLLRPVDAGNSP